MNIIEEGSQCIEGFTLTTRLVENNGIYFIESILKNGLTVDYILSPSVSDKYEKAHKIYEIIMLNGVFPCHICNIIDEI